MNKYLPKRFFVLSLIFSLIFFSCLSKKNQDLQQIFDQNQEYVKTGSFQNAIDGYSRALEDHPYEVRVIENYIRTVEEIRNFADRAYNAKNYSSACRDSCT